ncbi:MAG: DUF4340 domain-containing protein [Candidatus Hydrogenedentes bacterium]|nr:DUF4340 domain-containing protein [Candidatus Hydrogenedentota bacterium]
MSLKGTFILLAVLMLLCGVYWGLQRRSASRIQEKEEAKALFAFPPAAVQRLSIERVGEKASVAVRTAEGWDLVEPVDSIRALNLMWDRVAEMLAALKNERTLGDAALDPAQYGLAEPALVVRAEVEDAAPLALRFGVLDPTQRYRYAQQDSGPIFLADKNAFFELNRSLDELRHRFLVNDRESPLKYIEFVRIWTGREKTDLETPPAIGEESTRVVLHRDDPAGSWRMVEPVEAPANQETVEKLAAEIQFAMGRNFVDTPESLYDYGLEPPRARLTVEDFKGTGTQTFELGDTAPSGPKDGLFVRRLGEEAVFLVDGQLLLDLPRTPDALREQRLFTRQAKDLTRIEYAGGETRFTLERGPDEAWKLVAPEPAETDQLVVSNFIGSLKLLKAAAFLEGGPAAFGLEMPEFTITLFLEGESAPFEIRAKADPEHRGAYLATQDTGAVVRIPEAAAKQLMIGPGMLRSRQLLRFTKAEAQGIELLLDARNYHFEKVHGTWLVREPANAALSNQSDVEGMLDALTPLMSAGSVSASGSDLAAYGLTDPVARVTVTVQPPEGEGAAKALETLTIGKPRDDDAQQRYAALSGRTGVFYIKQDVVEALRRGVTGMSSDLDAVP